jgi:hypothetical protein
MSTLNTPENHHNEANYSKVVYRDHESLFNDLTEQEIKSAAGKKSSTAVKLARNAPKEHRGEMEKLFNISLFIHHRFEEIHKLPKQDINGAITIFLYGIWSIYNQGNTIPGNQFGNLVNHTQVTMRAHTEFLKDFENSTHENRSALYETFAMVGNWLLMIQHHLTSQPDDNALNNVKIMVREIITRSLKIEPESISISQEGELTITDQNCTPQ